MKTDGEKLEALVFAVRGFLQANDALPDRSNPQHIAVVASYLQQLRETVAGIVSGDGARPAPALPPIPAPADPFIRFEDRNERTWEGPVKAIIRESAVLSVARGSASTLCVLKLAGWPHHVTVHECDLPRHLRP